ncbi:aminopeptidase P family protein [Bradyrhizobium sp. U87765 SZCCT0131]|uniref:M24 family metallopeptidase n=1 Tax=unclassified Bradyrhizobium TaxID=2631580 RepID=UPI001BA631EF|nr:MULTISPECIES: Xaa-Pro peptidase family protein [unclassified Bradyrhizobium]MBR1222989.1 aminopeptidase P family protein [Bradyrhizobium sp. U87765 SZCCT0131]MBR1262725.1 aminopeptidase P family protein [Bradyrhizobium sp. U87765 SZCCT0134]MBR1308803.1 aminopeptidase P family protein [Bradyrhizobium sp. U87765 SZCCT0110]MBR1318507.1 aminopeptidase P family protein [Bradyrhizobium sp. U87765 SZCCT0109]MBR1352211.1 aminopeptidase P family protein [Bradyrhizobium sp. U87765 SZCCT0048]
MTTILDDVAARGRAAPFDTGLLDRLMDDAGLDVVVLTSKHNVQYLLGGYQFFFFHYMDAIGISRYLPAVVYQKGRPGNAAYFANALEIYEKQLDKFWLPTVDTSSWGSRDAITAAARHIRAIGAGKGRIGVEMSFLPADAHAVLMEELPAATIVDAHLPLERLRARKSEAELELLRQASERVVDAMLTTFARVEPGMSKLDIVAELRRQEFQRDLTFEYCLITAGADHNRSPSGQRLASGDILSIDSGGNYRGYIGDLCRMGILGQPDAELEDLLAEVEDVQQATRRAVRSGVPGGSIIAAGESAVGRSPNRARMAFTAHGMGLISHEAPRLTGTGFVPYPGYDENRSIESGMVISIETAIAHPTRGYVKLEDTVAVTDTGCIGFGDAGRGWNRCGGR